MGCGNSTPVATISALSVASGATLFVGKQSKHHQQSNADTIKEVTKEQVIEGTGSGSYYYRRHYSKSRIAK